MEKECIICNKIFYKKKNESKKYWETKRYCSDKCRCIDMHRMMNGRKITWGDKITKAKLGHKVSEEARINIGLGGIGKHIGDKNGNWKGENIKYYGLHSWISNNFGKAKDYKCKMCGKTGRSKEMHWSNKDHKYSRNIEDWQVLCAKCHNLYDINLKKLKINKLI